MHKGCGCKACEKGGKKVTKEKFKISPVKGPGKGKVPTYSAVSGTLALDAADVIRGAASAGVKRRLSTLSARMARLALYKKAKQLGLGT